MPAQPARSLVSLCSVSSSGPLAWPLGAPEASVRPGCAWLWRRCCIRVPDGGEPWPVFISLVAPAFLQYLPAHPHPGCRKTGSGSPGMGWLLSPGLTRGLGMTEKSSLPSEESLASGRPERIRFRRQNCLPSDVRDFTPPPPRPLLHGDQT